MTGGVSVCSFIQKLSGSPLCHSRERRSTPQRFFDLTGSSGKVKLVLKDMTFVYYGVFIG